MRKKILIVAAHPDDEILGCAGTIARHVNNGDKVYVVFMSDGVTSRSVADSNEVEARKQAAKNASNILGISESPRFLGFLEFSMFNNTFHKIHVYFERAMVSRSQCH